MKAEKRVVLVPASTPIHILDVLQAAHQGELDIVARNTETVQIDAPSSKVHERVTTLLLAGCVHYTEARVYSTL